MKDSTRSRIIIASFILPAAAMLELFAFNVIGPTVPTSAAFSSRWAWLDRARVVLPILLVLGTALIWALSLGKKDTKLHALFSREGGLRLALLLLWIVAVSLVDEFEGRSPILLLIGFTAAALFGWRKPRLLAVGTIAGSASIALADFLMRGSADPARLLLVAAAAVLSIATGATIRSAFLRSADRLNSLEKENKKLWELSFRDGLTGLYNRRYSQEIGMMLFARAKRYNEQLNVLMLDIDHFKLVNDKLGHPIGDEVLKDIAEILVSQVRASDVVMRYGGEEFMIFLIQTEPEVVQFIANRIRDGIATHVFPNVPWQVTISIGVSGIKADDTIEDLVDRADKYLYASKRGGRNRVTGF